MAGWTSTTPDVMSALVALWDTAVPGVQVSDGPWAGNDGSYQAVAVGYDGNDGAAHVEISPAGYGGEKRESYTIFCAVCVVDGEPAFGPVRSAAFAIYDACMNAIEPDRSLGGLVLEAAPGSYAVHQSATTAGSRVLIAFGVQVSAYTKNIP